MSGLPLFRVLLGDAFESLPARVQQLHLWQRERQPCWTGRCDIERGSHPLAWLCGWIAGLPPTRAQAVTTIAFQENAGAEYWSRDFGGARMRSCLQARAGLLSERLGPVEFRFALHVEEASLHWQVRRVHLFGLLPLPSAWFAKVRSREWEDAGTYHFEVDAALPLIGRIVRYRGWLQPAAADMHDAGSAGALTD